ncbi:MAG: nucleotidyltransferase [Thermodesulfobacteriota bacterium]|nr:nucleotidyltransferase [Thermodesulfobacteriota bacterium]
MRTVGLITEYNPFHNGHLHHLQESLRVTGADVSVAVMSGHFLQRGEPALIDKWARAEMALAAGVDLVVELPLPWAASSAPDFARGAVQALDALGVGSLCFGSESGDVAPLQYCADVLHNHAATITRETSKLLRRGINYPQARLQILAELLPSEIDPAVLAEPNNILGIEYIKALSQSKRTIQPATIHRIGAGYHDTKIGLNGIASATGIRKKLAEGEPVDSLMPLAVAQILERIMAVGNNFSADNYFRLLLAQVFRNSAGLVNCWLIENGIENRLLSVAEKSLSLEELLVGLKSRQLTRTRIQRLLISILLEMDKNIVRQLFSAEPHYLHLLAVSEKGRQFLASSRKQRKIPLIQNFSRVYATLKRYYGAESTEYYLASQQLKLELRATKIYTLLMHNYSGDNRNRDFYEEVKNRELKNGRNYDYPRDEN